MRINITLNDELLKEVDTMATKLNVSRSAYIAFALSQKLQSDKLIETMPQMMLALAESQKVKK